MATVRPSAAERRRTATGILMRIAFSRVCSSSTSALSPATRPMMKISWPNMAGKPRSTRTAASAPSMLSGIGLMRSRDRRFERAREADAVAFEAGVFRQAEEDRDARVDRRVHPVPETGQPRLRRLRFVDQFAPRPRRTTRPPRARVGRGPPDQLHAAGSRAAVLVADREDAGGDRGGQRLRGCPTRPAAPRRRTARRRRDPRRRPGSRRAGGVRPPTAAAGDAAGRCDR